MIPKIIWTYWHSLDDMPDFVTKCISSWYLYNPNYKINVITSKTISKFLGYQDAWKIKHWKNADSVQRISDLVRLFVLTKYGGIWMDASCIVYDSLDWVHDLRKDVVMYYIPDVSEKHGRPVPESWFIGCTRENEFITRVKNEFFGVYSVSEYISKLDVENLNFDFEYLLIYLVFKKILEEMKYTGIILLDASEGPYLYQSLGGIHTICEMEEKPKFFKFRKNERSEMNEEIEKVLWN